jgi:hypothetical protein
VAVLYPPGRFHAKTTIGPEWFHQLQCSLVIHFRHPDWLHFLREIGRRARGFGAVVKIQILISSFGTSCVVHGMSTATLPIATCNAVEESQKQQKPQQRVPHSSSAFPPCFYLS